MPRMTVAQRRVERMNQNRLIHERGHFTPAQRENLARFDQYEWERHDCKCGAFVLTVRGGTSKCDTCLMEDED
jgi:hypothetical protein